jgi:hypothetical protein
MYRTTIALLIAVAVLSGGYSLAATYQILPTEDTWTYSFQPDNNYGSDTGLGVAIHNMSQAGYTFLKFTMPTLQSGEIIKSATLHLYQYGGGGYGEGPTALDLLSNNTWSETTATWNNHPVATYTRLATNTDGHSHVGWSLWSFTWNDSYGDTISLRLAENSSGDQSHNWYSKEYADSYKPYLELTTSPRSLFDLNADGNTDFLWRYNPTGAMAYWLMDGVTILSGGGITMVDSSWQLTGTPDLNSDGEADLLWRHTPTGTIAYWIMSGANIASTGTMGSVDTSWRIAGTPDLNADGKPDLLWQHTPTGTVAVWYMNGTTMTSSAVITAAGTDWQIAGTPDLNNDGKPDILWRQVSTGLVAYWLMDGITIQAGGGIATVTPSWQIVGTPDLNNDGKPDILWFDATTKTVAYWYMNGTSYVSGGAITAVPSGWDLIGPK